jgi:hypothetical protein
MQSITILNLYDLEKKSELTATLEMLCPIKVGNSDTFVPYLLKTTIAMQQLTIYPPTFFGAEEFH